MNITRTYNNRQPGFTIVELLVVIVVIAIIASVSLVTYNGIQNRAHDAAIRSDIQSIVTKFQIYKSDNGVLPVGTSQLGTLDLKVSKPSYGNGMSGNAHNILYCRVAADGPDKFALIAASKSGNVFVYRSTTETVETRTSWYDEWGGSPANCQGAGINQVGGADRDFFYLFNAWSSYAG